MEQYITIHDCSTGISKNIGISELYRILWGSEPEDENSLTGAIAVQDAEKRKLTSYVVNEGGTDGYVGIYTDASDEDTVFQMCSAELPNESADGLLAKYTGRLYAGNEDEENDEPVAVTFAGYRDTDDESKHVVFVNDNTSNAFVPMSENFGTWLTENEMEDNIVPMHVCRPINKTSRILVMDKYVPVMEYLATTDYAFVVFPSPRGGFNAQVVPVSKNDQTAKVPFPQVWWGAEECNLPEHVTFCHASGFLLAADTEAAAIAACNTALIEHKDNVG